MTTLRYTRHAEVVLRERGLERAWIEQAIAHPDWVEFDPNQPEVERRFKRIAEREGRVLRVAVVQFGDEARILTAFFDRDARPK